MPEQEVKTRRTKKIDPLAVKFIDEEKGLIEGYGFPYGGPMNGKDLQGEYFTSDTDLCEGWFPTRPILFHHGLDDALKAAPIGFTTGLKADDKGRWLQGQLDKSNAYWTQIKELIKAGKLFFSSHAVPHLVQKEADGKITRWPWVESTLTPSPANPLATVSTFKAIEWLKAVGVTEDALKAIEETEQEESMAKTKKDFEKPEGSPGLVKVDNKTDPAAAAMNGEKPNLEPTAGMAPGTGGPGNVATVTPPAEQPVKSLEVKAVCEKCGGEMKTYCPKCSTKSLKGIELPEQVVQALVALHNSIEEIVPGVCDMGGEDIEKPVEEQKPPEKPPEAPPTENNPPPENPGVNQGMSPENHVTKPEEEKKAVDAVKSEAIISLTRLAHRTYGTQAAMKRIAQVGETETLAAFVDKVFRDANPSVKAMATNIIGPQAGKTPEAKPEVNPVAAIKSEAPDAIKSLLDGYVQKVESTVKEALKGLEGRLEILENSPASEGPVRRVVKTNDGAAVNTRIGDVTENSEKEMLDKLLKEATDPATKSFLGEKVAAIEMKEVMARGPQQLRR